LQCPVRYLRQIIDCRKLGTLWRLSRFCELARLVQFRCIWVEMQDSLPAALCYNVTHDERRCTPYDLGYSRNEESIRGGRAQPRVVGFGDAQALSRHNAAGWQCG